MIIPAYALHGVKLQLSLCFTDCLEKKCEITARNTLKIKHKWSTQVLVCLRDQCMQLVGTMAGHTWILWSAGIHRLVSGAMLHPCPLLAAQLEWPPFSESEWAREWLLLKQTHKSDMFWCINNWFEKSMFLKNYYIKCNISKTGY